MITILLGILCWCMIGILIISFAIYKDIKQNKEPPSDLVYLLFISAILGPLLLIGVYAEWKRN